MEAKELTTIKVDDTDNSYTVTKVASVSWKSRTVQEELEQIGIVYNGGCHAVMVIPRKMNKPLFVLGQEDDDRIFFEKYQDQYSHSFDMGWSEDLVKVVKEAYQREIKKM